VDTIEFTEADETMDLPPPMSLSELQHMSLVQKKANFISTNEMDDKKEEDQAGDMDVSTIEIKFVSIFYYFINVYIYYLYFNL